MQLNGVAVVDRHNRPTVLQKVALRAFFINDGEYYDPYDISGVTVFQQNSNFSPSSVLEGNLLASGLDEDLILMHFTPSGDDGGTTGQDPSGYVANSLLAASGVYRVRKGEYVAVLDGTQDSSGIYDFHGSSVTIANSASASDNYIDCWTIKFAESSDYQTLINEFRLYDDTFFTITQPLLLASRNKLINRHITLDSIENLKVTTEITVQNKDIDDSIKNLFKDSAITSAKVKIDKINEDSTNLPAYVTVSGFDDTASLVDITSDNTIIFRFDTTTLTTHPSVADFAGVTGTYRLTAKYNLLNETIVSPPYYFTVS